MTEHIHNRDMAAQGFKRENNVVQEDKKDEKQIDKKFRFANQYVMLTYKTWIEKKAMRQYFKDNFGAKEVEIAHETGAEGYQHTHIVINFGKAFQSRNVRVFDINEIHPHIQPFKRHEWDTKINYIAKEDPENAHLKKKTLPTLASKIWTCETVHEALLTAQKPSDVPGIIALYNNKPKFEKIDNFELRKWQQEVYNMLQTKADDRKIIWIRDKNGGAGKSRFAKFMALNHGAVLLKQFGALRDVSQIIADAVEKGWNQQVIMIDLARSFADRDIYTALENLKDGAVTSTKYAGKTVTFESPHIVVTANFWPIATAMSLDRWILLDIVKNDKSETYNINEVSVYTMMKEEGETKDSK